jgi:hypothetical protein
VEPPPDFLLMLAPMLREGPPTDLLIATPGNRKCIEERLKWAAGSDLWFVEPVRHARIDAGRTGRKFDGDRKDLLRQLRAACYPQPKTVVVADRTQAEPAMLGCLWATARRAPLYLVDRGQPLDAQLDATAAAAGRIECIGSKDQWKDVRFPGNAKRAYVNDAEKVLARFAESVGPKGEHVVVVRAPSGAMDQGGVPFWALAVSLAVKHHAAIVLAKAEGDLDKPLAAALDRNYPNAKYVTLLGNEETLPLMQVRDPADEPAAKPAPKNAPPVQAINSVEAIDEVVEEQEDPPIQEPEPKKPEPKQPEPKKPEPAPAPPPPKIVRVDVLNATCSGKPCRYRVGRITGDSLATTSLLASGGSSNRPAPCSQAWMMANVGGKLPMLECIARATEQELSARGWLSATSYGADAPAMPLDRFLAADLVIYQGHTADLGHFSRVSQQIPILPPILVVLQGCVSLQQGETMSLLQRGAAGVLGCNANMFSASGGAFTKAFCDALTEGHDAGTSLMIARNYMLALSLMKKNRGHQQCGRPLRAAMTFSFLGDPTWKLSCVADAPHKADRVHAVREGQRVDLHIPADWPEDVRVAGYHAVGPLGGKFSGVYAVSHKHGDEKRLVPQFFAVVPMEDWKGREAPVLSSKLPNSRWVSLWDPHNRWLYLLVWGSPSSQQDRGKVLSFDVR